MHVVHVGLELDIWGVQSSLAACPYSIFYVYCMYIIQSYSYVYFHYYVLYIYIYGWIYIYRIPLQKDSKRIGIPPKNKCRFLEKTHLRVQVSFMGFHYHPVWSHPPKGLQREDTVKVTENVGGDAGKGDAGTSTDVAAWFEWSWICKKKHKLNKQIILKSVQKVSPQ